MLTVFTGECGTCRQCTSGKSNLCQILGLERRGVMHSDQGTRFTINGKPIYHYCAVSSFSEYTVVHSGCAVKINPTVPLDKVCLLSCGVAAGRVSDHHIDIKSHDTITFCSFNICICTHAYIHTHCVDFKNSYRVEVPIQWPN